MEQEHPMISIVVPVYNHEHYIERCLRSILAQKCSYSYEVWIGEDCSPDNTRTVMQALEPEFPDYFHFLYREKNLGGQNSTELAHRCTGKYLCILEGDDFWTYEGKLQAQVDFMEAHPDYIACFHHCTVVGEDSEPNGEKYPECLNEEYTLKEFFYSTLPGQTATICARRAEYEAQKTAILKEKRYDKYPADRRNAFMLIAGGKVRVFQEAWSAYRHVVASGTSYSAKVKINEAYATNDLNFGRTLVAFAEEQNNPEALKIAKMTYYRLLLKWSVGSVKIASLSSSLKELFSERAWPVYLLAVPRWYIVLGVRSLMGKGVNL